MRYLRLVLWMVLVYLLLAEIVIFILVLSWCIPITTVWLADLLPKVGSLSHFHRNPLDIQCAADLYYITGIIIWAFSIAGDLIRTTPLLSIWLMDTDPSNSFYPAIFYSSPAAPEGRAALYLNWDLQHWSYNNCCCSGSNYLE
jgi:hypothetical protein